MSLRNLFRAQDGVPSLRDRAAGLRTILGKPSPKTNPLPAPGSAEAMAAWHAACHLHTTRTAALHDCLELMRSGQDVWTTQSLSKALETGEITASEYARLHPLASERELRFAEVAHELNIGGLFALAYAGSYPVKADDDDGHGDAELPSADESDAASDASKQNPARRDVLNGDLSREAFDYAHGLDLAAVPFGNLIRLYEVFHRTSDLLSDAEQETQFWTPTRGAFHTAGGVLIHAEQNRLGCLRDACAMELARRTPKTEEQRDAALVLRIRHEMLSEGEISSKAILAEIREAWSGE